jgi:hypothetical protein
MTAICVQKKRRLLAKHVGQDQRCAQAKAADYQLSSAEQKRTRSIHFSLAPNISYPHNASADLQLWLLLPYASWRGCQTLFEKFALCLTCLNMQRTLLAFVPRTMARNSTSPGCARDRLES